MSVRLVDPNRTPTKASAVLLVRLGVSDFEVLVGARQLLLGIRHIDLLGNPSLSPTSRTIDYTGACTCLDNNLGGILQSTGIHDVLQRAPRSVILTRSGLTLHLVEFDAKDKLLDAYERLRLTPSIEKTHELIDWVPWLALVVAARGGRPTETTTRLLVEKFESSRTTYRVSEVLEQVVIHHAEEIEGHMEHLVVARMTSVEATPHRVVKLPPPIDVVQPHEADYKYMCKLLPKGFVSRVITIRRVRVPSRVEEFEEFERSSSEKLQLVEPVFHGTPERWRATAIAMEGFNLQVSLHGRSNGPGVYTGADTTHSATYAGTDGSILLLRGLRSRADFKGPSYYVFRDPKALLPLLIADFGFD